MSKALRHPPRLCRAHARGFTLLEIVIAVTILATFLLPMMLIISNAKVRAIRYTQRREVRDLAQRKLFDRITYYEESDSGDFTLEGHPDWKWVVDPPEMVGTAEQALLQYTIHVTTPQKIDEDATTAKSTSTDEGSTYDLTLWAFPDSRWYEDQTIIYQNGGYSPLYGSRIAGGAQQY